MKIRSLALLLGVALLLSSGCDFENKKYKGKTFLVRTELRSGEGVEVVTWTNANRLTYNSEDYAYDFYVNGKLVTLDPRGTVIIEEQ